MSDTIGWDLGGAHLKAARLDATGRIRGVVQRPCPLWKGLEFLEKAVDEVLIELGTADRHAVTMTGELADIFTSRNEGVVKLVDTMRKKLPQAQVRIFAGIHGFVPPESAGTEAQRIASANWLASGQLAAQHCREGIFIDMGSTTTDIIPMHSGKVCPEGLSDAARLASDELVYTGVIRSPLMAIAQHVPFNGQWQRTAAEYFATAADVHRLTGNLTAEHDMADTADGAGKSELESARRLARMVGRDFEDASMDAWRALANFYAEAQLKELAAAVERIASRHPENMTGPIVGAGAGRFIVRELARRSNRQYIDFSDLAEGEPADRDWAAVCAPAYAVAWLGSRQKEAAA